MRRLTSRALPAVMLAAGLTAGLAAGWAPKPAAAQVSGLPDVSAEKDSIRIYAYTLRHRQAGDALSVVHPLLSRNGTVELQPATNTLVVRDSLAALGRIVPALRAFDRQAERLRLEVMVVRAGRANQADGAGGRQAPEWLVRRLRDLLRWNEYTLLAEARLVAREGQMVTYELGEGYRLRFRLGSVGAGEQLRLHDFELWTSNGDRADHLLKANLNLVLGKPIAVGLTDGTASSRALMLVLSCRRLGTVSGQPRGGS